MTFHANPEKLFLQAYLGHCIVHSAECKVLACVARRYYIHSCQQAYIYHSFFFNFKKCVFTMDLKLQSSTVITSVRKVSSKKTAF